MIYTNQIEKFLEVNGTSIVCADILVVSEIGGVLSAQKMLLPIKHTMSQYNEFWRAIGYAPSERFYISGVMWLNNGDWIQVHKGCMQYFTVPSLPF